MLVGLYQMEDRESIEDNVKAVVNCIKKADVDVLCIPEFFAHPLGFFKELVEKFGSKAAEKAYNETWWVIEEIKRASRKFNGYIVAGTVVEKDEHYYNTCYVLWRGHTAAKYRKINIVDDEVRAGITPGESTISFGISMDNFSVKAGIMVCADCLNKNVVESVCRKAKIIFLPISMSSPDHPTVRGHPVSLKIAQKYGVVIAKTSRTAVYKGRKFGVKSAVITPHGVLAEAESVNEVLLRVKLPNKMLSGPGGI